MYSDNPIKEQRRRRVTIGIIAVLIISGVLFGFHFFHSYRRTDTTAQAKLMSSSTPTVVVFYSKTCSDCKHVTATVHKADYESRLADNVIGLGDASSKRHHVAYVEWQNGRDKRLFEQYSVKSVPTFMVFQNGQPQSLETVNSLPVYQYSGTDKQKIKQIFQRLTLEAQVTENQTN